VCLHANGAGVATLTITTDQPGFIARDTTFEIRVNQRWRDVAASSTNTCGLNIRSRVYCWGSGRYVGTGTAGDGRAREIFVPATVEFDQLFAGPIGQTSCALVAGVGVPYCWGANDFGSAGLGPNVAVGFIPAPLQGAVFLSLSMSGSFSCGVVQIAETPSGRLTASACWGWSDDFRMGHANLVFGGPCVGNFIPGMTLNCVYLPGAEITRSGLAVLSVAAGDSHGCAAGPPHVYCWGANVRGQLGTGAPGPPSATTLIDVPLASPGDTVIITAGAWHSCYLVGPRHADNPVYCWGGNEDGQSGSTASNVGCAGFRCFLVRPIRVSSNFAEISAGSTFTCGRTAAGLTSCWGTNEQGQLGRTGLGMSDVPLAVGLDSGRTFTKISAGRFHACGVSSGDGAIFCWGFNSSGQLGDGTTTDSPRPVRVVEPSR
jgi:alpha-tubulin suppressor-like RCC1 family protein